MNIIKNVFCVVIVILMSGCGLYDKRTIVHSCDNSGNLILTVYSKKLVSETEDIKNNRNLKHKIIVEVDGHKVICTKSNK